MIALSHSGHDFEELISRWRTLAHELELKETVISVEGGYEVFAFENQLAVPRCQAGGLYVSAGVHGDECAPPWALLQWVESEPAILTEKPVVIFPCLNPYGFVGNTRHDHAGMDLNRNFQDENVPLIGKWQEFLEDREFDLAINLHEDYDALGIYLYEVVRTGSRGDTLLRACSELIQTETAATVDGSEFKDGLLSHSTNDADLQRIIDEDLEGGCPEALWLAMHHATDSFTFETPSELALPVRIAAHRRFLEEVTRG
ncbi:MAG: M14 family metallocarboxypeptidase [Verrucomicrobiales bacterium]|nr:M14 family metallocarboxypeptidase [Verrucomicrobiales bacterium]